MDPLSFVIVGAGLIGPRHAESVLNHPECSLFAIVDRSRKGPTIASSCDTLHFNNIEEMFYFCETYGTQYPDAAIVCTPNDSHAEIGIRLAEKGIHILIEKPMASSAADCIRLIDTCEKYNVKLLIGHHRRFNPYIVETKKHMRDVGRPIAVQGVWALKKHQQYFDEKAWRRSKFSGGGTIMINLIHDLDLLQYLLGPITRVFAEGLPRLRQPEAEDDHVDEGAALTLRFANGCCGTFLCSDNVTSPFNFEAGTGENPLIPMHSGVAGFYRVFGSAGTLSVPDMTLYHQKYVSNEDQSWWNSIEKERFSLVHSNAGNIVRKPRELGLSTPPSSLETKQANFGALTEKLPKPFDLQVEHFVNLIHGTESEVKCSGYDALQSLLCIEAVAKSIDEGLPQIVQTASALREQMSGM